MSKASSASISISPMLNSPPKYNLIKNDIVSKTGSHSTAYKPPRTSRKDHDSVVGAPSSNSNNDLLGILDE